MDSTLEKRPNPTSVNPSMSRTCPLKDLLSPANESTNSGNIPTITWATANGELHKLSQEQGLSVDTKSHDSVMVMSFLFGIDCLKKKNGNRKAAKPLKVLDDLNLVIDKKWVKAAPVDGEGINLHIPEFFPNNYALKITRYHYPVALGSQPSGCPKISNYDIINALAEVSNQEVKIFSDNQSDSSSPSQLSYSPPYFPSENLLSDIIPQYMKATLGSKTPPSQAMAASVLAWLRKVSTQDQQGDLSQQLLLSLDLIYTTLTGSKKKFDIPCPNPAN
ncbi:hypothetical protein DSO57_1034433 [Entomophthora muscae]|uniref:Uncharacterized protein n=1 Tax=Entomophthora muscae TaxID=34485 RepID=A0ACC2RQV4_9FUNG|nr:hypothetical protein DSO57_1034433 [Entomophthora muscae]